jgi:transposase
MSEEYSWFVGIDWGSEQHQVCALDSAGDVLGEFVVAHSGKGLAELATRLERLCSGQFDRVAVGIEIPRDAVVDSLVERGVQVFSINPKQLDRFRDRHSAAGAKDDRRDAWVLANSLRTDRHCYRQVRLDHPLVIQIREMSRLVDELAEDRQRHTNRLWGLLQRYYPAVLAICPAANEPWLWELLRRAPTPGQGAKLKAAFVVTLLRRHRIRRLDAETVLAALRQPPLQLAPGVVEAAAMHVSTLLPRIEVAHAQHGECERRVGELLDELGQEDSSGQKTEQRDVQILLSFVGVGKKVAATLLAEASQPLAERDYHTLRARSGVAPVTSQSGKRRVISMRRACNLRLRNALYHWSMTATVYDEPSKARYRALRARGQSHGRALRTIADRLLRILVAMLKSGKPYALTSTSSNPTDSDQSDEIGCDQSDQIGSDHDQPDRIGSDHDLNRQEVQITA